MAKIHPTAVVSPDARLADSVEVGPYSVIEEDVEIGAGTRLFGQCRIGAHTTMGENNLVYPFAAIGTDPEDYAYDPSQVSYTRIGSGNRFREGVTVNRGTMPGSVTTVGDGCFLMANSHVAHNCQVGSKVILVTQCAIAGHCQIGDSCLISGLAGIHQFCRVGRMAVLSGGSAISMDLPPFMIGDGRNGGIRGFNIVGLRRNNFPAETIHAIKKLYDIFFRHDLNMKNAIAQAEAELPQLPEVKEFLDFVQSSKRGILNGHRGSRRA
ncbi:MAG: acyl-ACP--UDP-N-acetylglucosamine O-acyltransferase [Lentisphaeria bacterium]|nr:acyl-ACP--UDP-N-acetylglucosamine O-acyltransferase [Lentisphaeria bacterium]